MTNELLINRFLNHLRRDGKSVLTLSAYSTDLKQFLSLLPSPARLNASLRAFGGSPAGLETVCQKWTGGLRPNAAARKLTTLRSFLSWGYRVGYIKNDLAAAVSRPERKTISSAKPLSQSQIARLRRAATVQERLLLELLLQTGMRLSEVARVKIDHADVVRSELRYPISDIRIPISGHLEQALSYSLESKMQKASGYILTGPRGKRMSVRTASAILKKLSQKAGVLHATARNLRATFIVRQLEAGTPLSTIARIVGHERLTTTERYARLAAQPSKSKVVALADI